MGLGEGVGLALGEGMGLDAVDGTGPGVGGGAKLDDGLGEGLASGVDDGEGGPPTTGSAARVDVGAVIARATMTAEPARTRSASPRSEVPAGGRQPSPLIDPHLVRVPALTGTTLPLLSDERNRPFNPNHGPEVQVAPPEIA